jgi:hypothetical protein
MVVPRLHCVELIGRFAAVEVKVLSTTQDDGNMCLGIQEWEGTTWTSGSGTFWLIGLNLEDLHRAL